MGFRFPIFDDLAEFKAALDSAPIVNIDKLGDVNNMTKNPNIDDIVKKLKSLKNK